MAIPLGSNCQALELPELLPDPTPNELFVPLDMFMPTFMPLLNPFEDC